MVYWKLKGRLHQIHSNSFLQNLTCYCTLTIMIFSGSRYCQPIAFQIAPFSAPNSYSSAHLIASPECPELLGPVYTMLEARTKHYGKLLQLKGKLDMMTRQISALPDDETNLLPAKEALLGNFDCTRPL